MRAEFDTSCDFIRGPSTATPGVVVAADLPCRLVPLLQIFPFGWPLNLRSAYITIDEQVPAGPEYSHGVGGTILYDLGMGDQIAVPTGVAPTHYVLFTEIVYPAFSGPIYYRIHVAELPYVPLP